MCESTVVRPCPGKCLAQASAPAPWQPSIQVRTRLATRSGSSPKARVWTIGLSGSTSRSATGANTQLMPTARASWAVTAPAQRTTAASPSEARASGGGNWVNPSTCWPAPRSRSAAISSGRPARRNRSEVSRRTDSTVPPNRMKPPTPRSSASAMRPASAPNDPSAPARSAGMMRRPGSSEDGPAEPVWGPRSVAGGRSGLTSVLLESVMRGSLSRGLGDPRRRSRRAHFRAVRGG
jgi:hypothetical protein